MSIKMYTTHCPKCNVLEAKLNAKGIEYEKVSGADAIIEKGFQSAPLLEVDGKVLDFMDAIGWLNQQGA